MIYVRMTESLIRAGTAKYLFTEVRGKAVCLVCGEQIAVFTDYNLSRHYETKHAEKYKNLTEAEKARTSEP